jgi:hypothetical protein
MIQISPYYINFLKNQTEEFFPQNEKGAFFRKDRQGGD